MKRKRILSLFLISILLIITAFPSYAATTQDRISDAKTKTQEAQSNLKKAESKINELESKKNNSEAYLTELNQQLTDLNNSLKELQQRSQTKQVELQEVQAELQKAQEQADKQYQDMKIRIQFMYEKSSSSYLEMLLEAKTITEFLGKAENIIKINKYDRDMLTAYQETKEQVIAKEEAVKTEQEAIQKLQEESAAKQEEVENLVKATYIQVSTYTSELTQEQSAASELLAKVNSQEAMMNSLLKQQKDEEVAAAKAQQEQEAKAQKAKEQETTKQNQTSSKDSNSESNSKPNKNETIEEDSGSSNNAGSSDNTSSSKGEYLGRFRLTAYCQCPKCCGGWSGGPTASGVMPVEGRTVAMAGVPFGTKLLINGHVYTVEDRGTAYGHVDVFHNSHAAALQFGSQSADVYRVN